MRLQPHPHVSPCGWVRLKPHPQPSPHRPRRSLDRGTRSPTWGVVIGGWRLTVRSVSGLRPAGDADLETVCGESTFPVVRAVPERWLQARVRTRSGARDAGAIRCSSSRSSSSRPSVVAGSTAAGPPAPSSGVVPDSLRDKAKAHPKDAFHVVIQTTDGSQLDGLGSSGGRGPEEASRQGEGPDEEVQADRQRNGRGDRRPDRPTSLRRRASSA